jgi:hypothetical protein
MSGPNLVFRSCGTLTAAGIRRTGVDSLLEECTNSYNDLPNYCNTTPYTDSNGYSKGVFVFVKADCTTNLVLPMDQQAAIYGYPGVSTAQKP